MFLTTDSSWAPWYVVHSDNKRRARLNVLTHVLGKCRTRSCRVRTSKAKRQERGDYKDSDYPVGVIPEVF